MIMADDADIQVDGGMNSTNSTSSSLTTDAAELTRCTSEDHSVPTRDGWYWQSDDGRWHLFGQLSSKRIEDSRHNDPQYSVQFTRGKQSYVIDLKTMVQTNTATGKQRNVVRVGSGVADVTRPTDHLWFWESKVGRWHSFHNDDSDTINKQFAADPNGTFTLCCNDRIYSIDLMNNLQTNVETNDQYLMKSVPPVTQLTINRAVGKKFIWQWENDNSNWETFDASYGIVSSEAIETAFLADNKAIIAFHFNRFSYIIDLRNMKQTNESTGKERQIRRIELGKDDSRSIFPTTWTNNAAAAADLQLVPISSTGTTAKEHLAIVKLFAKTIPNYWLISVKRIQNRRLYQRFHLYRSQMEERLGTGKGVRRLFHGTSKRNIDAICQQGFDFRLKSTYAYGQGSYFARDASYSIGYSDCSTMFVAQVLVGEYTNGNSSMVRPPLNKKRGELYDSVVDEVKDPSIFVVFDIAHSYPEYLIEYSIQPQPAAARVRAPSTVARALPSPQAAPKSAAKTPVKVNQAKAPSKTNPSSAGVSRHTGPSVSHPTGVVQARKGGVTRPAV